MATVTANNLPIIDITKENCAEKWNLLISAVQNSTFIALDLEMSGLGNRKNLSLQCIEERYKTCCELANNYSVLSLGLSCFSVQKESGDVESSVKVRNKTFNILTLCEEEFLVEPKSLNFLIGHGFDFNKQFKSGLDYYRGNDRVDLNDCSSINEREKYSIRDLICQISYSKKPVVLHNGFIDLIFLYQNFYAKCPVNSQKFLADLEEIFAGGIYDTKYISDFHARLSATFLEYVYIKALHENTKMKSSCTSKHMKILFDFDSSTLDDFRIETSVNIQEVSHSNSICSTYAAYGYCHKIETCPKSHDVKLIIQMEMNKENKKKKNRVISKACKILTELSTVEVTDQLEVPVLNQIHSAGLDAFMTGYSMLNYINKFTNFKTNACRNTEIVELSEIDELETKFRNNIYLAGKDYPLFITKSNFTTTSVNHKNKKEKLINDYKNKII